MDTKTDEKGIARLTENSRKSVGILLSDFRREIGLPLGTITIQETQAPKDIFEMKKPSSQESDHPGKKNDVETYSIPVVKETVIRGDLQIVKYAKKTEYVEELYDKGISSEKGKKRKQMRR